jgi:hypothetical protein
MTHLDALFGPRGKILERDPGSITVFVDEVDNLGSHSRRHGERKDGRR